MRAVGQNSSVNRAFARRRERTKRWWRVPVQSPRVQFDRTWNLALSVKPRSSRSFKARATATLPYYFVVWLELPVESSIITDVRSNVRLVRGHRYHRRSKRSLIQRCDHTENISIVVRASRVIGSQCHFSLPSRRVLESKRRRRERERGRAV